MPDITVHRHGDRWAVAEAGAESPSKEFPTREAAEMAARQMAAGGTVDIREDDPTGLEHTEPGDAGRPARGAHDETGGTDGPGAPEGVRDRQAGL
jgi:Uncharacterized protein conserved in bacteria (DUF2188)